MSGFDLCDVLRKHRGQCWTSDLQSEETSVVLQGYVGGNLVHSNKNTGTHEVQGEGSSSYSLEEAVAMMI